MANPRILTNEPAEDVEPAPEAPQPDLDPASWLARDESDVTGYVSVRGGRLKVGALTQGEMERLRKAASQPNPRDLKGERIVDGALLNRLIIAHALNKANPGSDISHEQLAGKLTGDLTEIVKTILAQSGFSEVGERQELPFD